MFTTIHTYIHYTYINRRHMDIMLYITAYNNFAIKCMKASTSLCALHYKYLDKHYNVVNKTYILITLSVQCCSCVLEFILFYYKYIINIYHRIFFISSWISHIINKFISTRNERTYLYGFNIQKQWKLFRQKTKRLKFSSANCAMCFKIYFISINLWRFQ